MANYATHIFQQRSAFNFKQSTNEKVLQHRGEKLLWKIARGNMKIKLFSASLKVARMLSAELMRRALRLEVKNVKNLNLIFA